MKKIITTAVSVALLASSAFALTSTTAMASHHKMGQHVDLAKLDMALAAQDDKAKARYQQRHPKQTLEYFGITPGMKVGDIFPGGGWYSKILLPYLGKQGSVVGIDFSLDMWAGWRGDDERGKAFVEERKGWAAEWVDDAQDWRSKDSASLDAFALGAMPDKMKGSLDAVLFFRGMHHLNRFEHKGSFRLPALKEIYTALKPGGIFGIVQHRSPEESSDEWATGNNGYVKQSHVIKLMKEAGFELVGTSEVNANAKDVPGKDDYVWRLAPSLSTSRDDAAKRKVMAAIGESDRMTLKFRKPI
jgi:predicted methyltransferase